MSPQKERRGYCANYIQLIQLVPMRRKLRQYTIYSSIVHMHDFLPMPTGSAVCIWCNILVFHFAGSSRYNWLIYGHSCWTWKSINGVMQGACGLKHVDDLPIGDTDYDSRNMKNIFCKEIHNSNCILHLKTRAPYFSKRTVVQIQGTLLSQKETSVKNQGTLLSQQKLYFKTRAPFFPKKRLQFKTRAPCSPKINYSSKPGRPTFPKINYSSKSEHPPFPKETIVQN